MTLTEKNFFRLSMKDVHDVFKGKKNWFHSVPVVRCLSPSQLAKGRLTVWSESGAGRADGTHCIGFALEDWSRASSREGTIEAVAVPCHFGGVRYFFVCPVTRKKCQCLYFDGLRFVSREAAPFSLYASQMTWEGLDRRRSQSALALARLGVPAVERRETLIKREVPPPPKNMKRCRYDRLKNALLSRYEAQDQALLALLVSFGTKSGCLPSQ